LTVDAFGDFELTWEWKVDAGRQQRPQVQRLEELSVKEAPNHAALGFEYQILDDDRHPDGKLATHRAGALYDLIAPSRPTARPSGGANGTSPSSSSGQPRRHWLNGEEVLAFDLGTARMDSCLAKSKFRSLPWFGERRRGTSSSRTTATRCTSKTSRCVIYEAPQIH